MCVPCVWEHEIIQKWELYLQETSFTRQRPSASGGCVEQQLPLHTEQEAALEALPSVLQIKPFGNAFPAALPPQSVPSSASPAQPPQLSLPSSASPAQPPRSQRCEFRRASARHLNEKRRPSCLLAAVLPMSPRRGWHSALTWKSAYPISGQGGARGCWRPRRERSAHGSLPGRPRAAPVHRPPRLAARGRLPASQPAGGHIPGGTRGAPALRTRTLGFPLDSSSKFYGSMIP